MAIRTGKARWEGSISEGAGTVELGSGAFSGPYSFASRFEEGTGTNPEELIGAAHAGCFTMALSLILTEAGTPPRELNSSAAVQILRRGEGFAITKIELSTEGDVPGIDAEAFRKHAEAAKANCPVSKALEAVDIRLADARLRSDGR